MPNAGSRAGFLPLKFLDLCRFCFAHWVLASDRRHAKDFTNQMAELKADWRRVQKRLGKCRDMAGSLMPGRVVVQRRPFYVITRQLLGRWTQVPLLRVSDGSQRSIEGYFSRAPAPSKPARPARPAAPAPPMPGPSSTQTCPQSLLCAS